MPQVAVPYCKIGVEDRVWVSKLKESERGYLWAMGNQISG